MSNELKFKTKTNCTTLVNVDDFIYEPISKTLICGDRVYSDVIEVEHKGVVKKCFEEIEGHAI